MSTDEPSKSSRSISNTLLERLRGHDAEAWQRLADLYGPLVYHWCRRSGMRPPDAADTLQDVFTAVSVESTIFDEEARVRPSAAGFGSLLEIKIRDYFRARERQSGGRWGNRRPTPARRHPRRLHGQHCRRWRSPGTAAVFQRWLKIIQADFEDHTWNAFWRITVEGQDTAEVATALGMSANAVRQAKSRVLRRLRAGSAI